MLSVGRNLATGAHAALFNSRKIKKVGTGRVREQREHPREKHWKRAEKCGEHSRKENGNNYEGGQKQSALEVWLSLFYYLVCSGND